MKIKYHVRKYVISIYLHLVVKIFVYLSHLVIRPGNLALGMGASSHWSTQVT